MDERYLNLSTAIQFLHSTLKPEGINKIIEANWRRPLLADHLTNKQTIFLTFEKRNIDGSLPCDGHLQELVELDRVIDLVLADLEGNIWKLSLAFKKLLEK